MVRSGLMISHQDYLDICSLLYRFNHAVDYGTAAEWADTFLLDGSFESGPTGRRRGRAELIGWIEELRHDPKFTILAGCQHWVSNIAVTNVDEVTTVASYVILVVPRPEPHISMFGTYEDTVKKVDGDWKFSKRKFIASV